MREQVPKMRNPTLETFSMPIKNAGMEGPGSQTLLSRAMPF
jgi:hypothetical protein